MNATVQEQLTTMRRFFESGVTKSYPFRKQQLERLKAALIEYEEEFHKALYTDLKKSPEEAWVTETGFLLSELNNTLRNLRRWMQPERVTTNLVNLPSSSTIIREPLGVVLIIAPWNYPLQLLFTPLVGALAAGNCVVIKPSEFAPATLEVMRKLVHAVFPPEYVLLAEGDGATIVPQLMTNFRFDHVFYTGSTAIGKLIYKMAAEQLVPVTLELGGKSPCVVEADANIKVAAKRIAMTKFSNAGQMCVAPDYVLVHESVKQELMAELRTSILQFFGDDAKESYNYGKIINTKQFDRIVGYLSEGTIAAGGSHERASLFIAPTLLEDVSETANVMKDEIFGPVLPVIPFFEMKDALGIISQHPNPLAFYIFTSNKTTEKHWLETVAFGGGCVNNASWHLTNHNLPFGGRGFSGMGNYHGKFSFEVFTHKKGILKTPTWFDPVIKYPPFKGKLKLFKWIIR